MTESIVLHFAEPTAEKIITLFENISEYIDDTWYIPLNKDYLIMIYPYDNYIREYEGAEQLEIITALGSIPKLSFSIIIRRTQSNKACDFIKKLLIETLSEFHYVVDDNINKVWTKGEVEQDQGDFLIQYYY